jgi:hypothetical protein
VREYSTRGALQERRISNILPREGGDDAGTFWNILESRSTLATLRVSCERPRVRSRISSTSALKYPAPGLIGVDIATNWQVPRAPSVPTTP